MTYPIIPAGYGLKPVNLVGGQVFAGSTRSLPIPYGYATNIGVGDFVQLTRGFVNRLTVTSGSASTFPIGVFLGCSYTDPVTKQKRFSQYWPASTLAGDAVAVVTDDPDTVFKAVALSSLSNTTVASLASCMVGQNAALYDNGMSLATGDSLGGIASPTATAALTSTLPVRIVGLVAETSYALAYAGSSSSTTTLTLGTALTASSSGLIPLIGCEVGYIAANGQYIGTGSFVVGGSGGAGTAVSAGMTTLTLNQQPTILGSSANIPASSTVVLTTYQEALLKLNFGQHAYYAGLGVA